MVMCKIITDYLLKSFAIKFFIQLLLNICNFISSTKTVKNPGCMDDVDIE